MMRRSYTLLYIIALLTGHLLLSACNDGRVYDTYRHVDVEGWERNDTLKFSIGVSQSGLYSLNIGMRTNTSVPFQTLSMVMTRSQKSEPKQHSDTVSCNIVDREGKLLGRNGISSNEVRYHVRDIAMADSDSLFVCISHCMRRESLPGLTEVGLQLVRTNQ